MEEKFSMEWHLEWKIFSNGNGMEENCQYGM